MRRRQDAVDAQRRIAEPERAFMHDAAHTLRTPLAIAQLDAELVLAGLQPAHREPPHADVRRPAGA